MQGGLTTTMELTAAGRPFIYFPQQNHFEQNYHVSHRLSRFGIGQRMQYAAATTDQIVEAIVSCASQQANHRPIVGGGAKAAAELALTAL